MSNQQLFDWLKESVDRMEQKMDTLASDVTKLKADAESSAKRSGATWGLVGGIVTGLTVWLMTTAAAYVFNVPKK